MTIFSFEIDNYGAQVLGLSEIKKPGLGIVIISQNHILYSNRKYRSKESYQILSRTQLEKITLKPNY